MVGWTKRKLVFSNPHYPQSLCDQKLFLLQINLSVEECPRSLQFSEISVCECEKHLYFQVRLTVFAPPLLFQRHWRHEVVQVTTLLYRFSWERVPCFVVICMLLPCILCTEWSVTTPPPPKKKNTYLKNSQTSGSLLWSKSLHKHLRGFLSSGVKASWWYIWLTSPTRATNFFRNLTRILNSSVCNFGPGNAWLF